MEDNKHTITPNTIICGDAKTKMKQIPDKSVGLIVTSPPYSDARQYEQCEGYNFDFDSEFKPIARECARVLDDGGTIAWIVGDTVSKGSKTLIPFDQARFFKEECDLRVHDIMYYEKNSSSFPARRNGVRCTNQVEYIIVLSKGRPRAIDLICDKRNNWAGHRGFGTATKRSADGTLVQTERKITPEFSPRPNIWRYCTGKRYTSKDLIVHEHPAPMPDLLGFDLIRQFSKDGDIVLDPMAGSGTVCVMAKVLGRNYIGIEISDKYCELIERRLLFKHDREDLERRSAEQQAGRNKPAMNGHVADIIGVTKLYNAVIESSRHKKSNLEMEECNDEQEK